ncbi:unnamed protein product [Musa textilis]
MKASHLLYFVLTLLLQLCCCWCSADQRTLGGNDEARRLPQLLKAQPLQGGLHDVVDLVSVAFTIFGCSLTELLAGLNVTAEERGENKEHLDEGTSISHSGKGSGAGKGGGKGAGGGSQTLRQPRDQRNSSAKDFSFYSSPGHHGYHLCPTLGVDYNLLFTSTGRLPNPIQAEGMRSLGNEHNNFFFRFLRSCAGDQGIISLHEDHSFCLNTAIFHLTVFPCHALRAATRYWPYWVTPHSITS